MTNGQIPLRTDVEVAIVGGGPAGLAAAHWLARYRRRVRLFDAGAPRNASARAVHGYPGLPDLSPAELRRRLRDQARRAGAEVLAATVATVSGEKNAFLVTTTDGRQTTAHRVLLASGRRDRIPAIPGLAATYGITTHHCPDCDGPEAAGQPVGVIGWDRHAAALALYLLTWTDRVTLLAHGHPLAPGDAAATTLRRCAVPVRTERVTRIVAQHGRIERVEFAGGGALAIRHLFFHPRSVPGSRIGQRLGCAVDDEDCFTTDAGQETTVSGVYAAGDATAHPHLAAIAAAEGIRAALAIHRSLLPPEYEL